MSKITRGTVYSIEALEKQLTAFDETQIQIVSMQQFDETLEDELERLSPERLVDSLRAALKNNLQHQPRAARLAPKQKKPTSRSKAAPKVGSKLATKAAKTGAAKRPTKKAAARKKTSST